MLHPPQLCCSSIGTIIVGFLFTTGVTFANFKMQCIINVTTVLSLCALKITRSKNAYTAQVNKGWGRPIVTHSSPSLRQSLQHLHKGEGGIGVETSGWLVKEDNSRICDEANPHRDPAPLSSTDSRDCPINILSDPCVGLVRQLLNSPMP